MTWRKGFFIFVLGALWGFIAVTQWGAWGYLLCLPGGVALGLWVAWADKR